MEHEICQYQPVQREVSQVPARRSATRKKTTAKAKKWVYLFVDGKAEGSAKMRSLLGGKGAGIAEMTNAGLPVPPGFTITTQRVTPISRPARSCRRGSGIRP